MKTKREKDLKTSDLNELAANIEKWISSPKGQKSIREVLRNSTEITTKVREAVNVDPKSLHDPITV